MGFERFRDYKKVASQYKGEPLETNQLAIILKETCPKEWIKIRNNSYKEWPGELYEDRIGLDGKRERWAYRPNDHYDSVLFCMLFIQFEGKIRSEFNKIRKYEKADEDDFLGEAEDWICQTIRHYIPENNNIKKDTNNNITKKKDASFKTLANLMLSNCTTNYMYKYLGLTCHDQRDKKEKKINTNTGEEYKNGQKIKHEIDYSRVHTISLDKLNEDKRYKEFLLSNDDLNEEANNSRVEENIEKLRNKYIEEGDLISWMILDWQSDYSKILQNQYLIDEILKEEKNDNSLKYNKANLKKVIIKILQNPDLCKEFGFSHKRLINLFSCIDNDFNSKQTDKIFDSTLNKLYKGSIKTLQVDVRNYGMCL